MGNYRGPPPSTLPIKVVPPYRDSARQDGAGTERREKYIHTQLPMYPTWVWRDIFGLRRDGGDLVATVTFICTHLALVNKCCQYRQSDIHEGIVLKTLSLNKRLILQKIQI